MTIGLQTGAGLGFAKVDHRHRMMAGLENGFEKN